MGRADKVGLVLNEVRQPANQVVQSFIHSPIHLLARLLAYPVCFSILMCSCTALEIKQQQKHGLFPWSHGTERKEVDVRQMVRDKVSAHMRKLVRFQTCP